jgi:alkylation response protein AidB-like acyl-CoA dehydrogenase
MVEVFTSDLLKEVLPKIQKFIHEEIVPLEPTLMNSPCRESEKGILNEKRNLVKKLGLWAPHLPKAEGGLGLNFMEFAQVSEVMAWSPFGHFLFNCQAPDIGNMELMEKYADKSLKDKYLNPLHECEIRS